MDRALKALVVPEIRRMGFTGSWPHFRRERGAEFQMIMFMFDKYGGAFCIEGGCMPQAELRQKQQQWLDHGKSLAAGKLTVAHCALDRRQRFGAEVAGADHWFEFGPRDYEVAAGKERRVMPPEFYRSVAADALAAIERDSERFFSAAP